MTAEQTIRDLVASGHKAQLWITRNNKIHIDDQEFAVCEITIYLDGKSVRQWISEETLELSVLGGAEENIDRAAQLMINRVSTED
jgi:hypothetical protein